MKIKKLAVANRGEVAVRIIRAAKEMDIPTVLLHSEPDQNTVAYRLADEAVCIGPAPSQESYLNMDKNIEAALSRGCNALHPGFGFLSENHEFAQKCLDNKIQFVGPKPESILAVGDKVQAKLLAKKLQIPTIPGFEGDDSNIEQLKKEAHKIGFPLIVKASGGGGGRGLKIVRDENDFEEMVQSAQSEAKSSFGSSRIFLEKYFMYAKHIEVQIFGDSKGRVVHLFERECSVQRRHQKIIEEATASELKPEVRAQITQAACKLAQAVNYIGAGTVEFLVDQDNFYFMEMNTRLQVEHPVTELVLGVDLVRAQLMVAQGEHCPWTQEELKPRGHAIECRLYAEDAYNNGTPSIGKIEYMDFPEGLGRRYEVGFSAGDEVTAYYDSMLAKIIVWDENRILAIQRMLKTLDDTVVFGLHTNIPLLKAILEHDDFISGRYTTQFINTYFSEGLKPSEPTDFETQVIDQVKREFEGSTRSDLHKNIHPNPWFFDWKS